jgi:hypothetical protein
MLMFFTTGKIVTALPQIRRKLFELFYYVHISFAMLMMACAYYHRYSRRPDSDFGKSCMGS